MRIIARVLAELGMFLADGLQTTFVRFRVQTRAAEVAGEILSITAVQISWRIGLELTKIRAKFTVRPVDGGRLVIPKFAFGLMLSKFLHLKSRHYANHWDMDCRCCPIH